MAFSGGSEPLQQPLVICWIKESQGGTGGMSGGREGGMNGG